MSFDSFQSLQLLADLTHALQQFHQEAVCNMEILSQINQKIKAVTFITLQELVSTLKADFKTLKSVVKTHSALVNRQIVKTQTIITCTENVLATSKRLHQQLSTSFSCPSLSPMLSPTLSLQKSLPAAYMLPYAPAQRDQAVALDNEAQRILLEMHSVPIPENYRYHANVLGGRYDAPLNVPPQHVECTSFDALLDQNSVFELSIGDVETSVAFIVQHERREFIQRLDFAKLPVIDRHLELLFKHCSRLERIDLSSSIELTDQVFEKLAAEEHVFVLEELALEGCEKITNKTIAALSTAKSFKKLVAVDFSNCPGVTKEVLPLLLTSPLAARLAVIVMDICDGVHLDLLLNNCPCLTICSLSNSNEILDEVFVKLKTCDVEFPLEFLMLNHCENLTNQAVKAIAGASCFAHLTTLDVSGCKKITKEILPFIATSPLASHLQILKVNHGVIATEDLTSFSALDDLKIELIAIS